MKLSFQREGMLIKVFFHHFKWNIGKKGCAKNILSPFDFCLLSLTLKMQMNMLYLTMSVQLVLW